MGNEIKQSVPNEWCGVCAGKQRHWQLRVDVMPEWSSRGISALVLLDLITREQQMRLEKGNYRVRGDYLGVKIYNILQGALGSPV